MPTILALIISSCIAYIPEMLFGDSLSGPSSMLLSFLIGTVAFYAIRSFMRNLRGG